jgi:hypothetical protein
MKREIVGKVMAQITADYDFNRENTASVTELLGIENQLPAEGIIPLKEMAQYIDKVNSDRIIKLSSYDRSSIYLDEELQFIDQLIDDNVINCLLSYDGYSPSMREILPSQLLKAELLKAIKYPEISCRKFCYFLHHFYKSSLLGDHTLCGVDSTELANDCKTPLASLNIKGK